MSFKYKIFFLIFLLSLLFLSIFLLKYLQNDAIQFSDLGFNLCHKGIYNSAYGVVPGWAQSPGWPIVISILNCFIPLENAASLGSFLLNILLLFTLFHFVRKVFNPFIAVFSILVLGSNPLFLYMARSGLAEPLFILLNFILFIRFYYLIFKEKKINKTEIIFIGILTYFLLMVRAEGVLNFIIIIFLLLFFNRIYDEKKLNVKKAYLNNLLTVVIFISIVILGLYPYGNWVKKKSGDFNIFPKITYNIRIMKLSHLLKEKYKIDSSNEEMLEELGWFALDPNTKELYSTNILNNEYFHNLKKEFKVPKANISSFLNLLKKNTIDFLRIIIRSSPFPLFFTILILVGLYYFFKYKKRELFFIFGWLLPSTYFILSHIEERFFFVFLPYLSFIAAFGIYYLARKFQNPKLIFNLALFILILNSSIYYFDYYHFLKHKTVYSHLAQELKQMVSPPNKICAKEFTTTFYSGNGFAKMPLCSINDLTDYLKIHNVKYLLLGGEVNNLRKQFKPIFNENRSDQYKRVRTFYLNNETFKLFKVTN